MGEPERNWTFNLSTDNQDILFISCDMHLRQQIIDGSLFLSLLNKTSFLIRFNAVMHGT